jgi:hypothetical protein
MSQRKSFLLFPEPDEQTAMEYLDDLSILEEVLEIKNETDAERVFDSQEELITYERTHNCRGIPIIIETDLPKEEVISALRQHNYFLVAEHVKKVNEKPATLQEGKFSLQK